MGLINDNFYLRNQGISNSAENINIPRHRWYFYKEGFSPKVVESAISNMNLRKGELVIDPFNGSGTVTLVASKMGFSSVGIEVNPFASFISKTKLLNISDNYISNYYERDLHEIIISIKKGKSSSLLRYSTFSEDTKKDKWLFNPDVLNSFEGGVQALRTIKSYARPLFKLALIKSAMDNANAKKDGKCLRYLSEWKKLGFNKISFLNSFKKNIEIIKSDAFEEYVEPRANILLGDSRKILSNKNFKFRLCITSPPYLNSFDYTDIYRPELFLGEFITSSSALKNLRLKTVTSHINLERGKYDKFQNYGLISEKILKEIEQVADILWSKRIQYMIKSYFNDIENTLQRLHLMGSKDSHLWLVVANSAYANIEIPTDLIIAEIGSKVGWKLREIGVLRYIHKRGSKYSPDIKSLRESVIVMYK